MSARRIGPGRRSAVVCSLGLALGLATPAAVAAHRLDEYLQAAQIAIDFDAISVDVYLTPGISIAPAILRTIDTDGDSDISSMEARSYAEAAVRAWSISLDGRPLALTRVSGDSAPVDAMRSGTGAIHVRARADVGTIDAGRHSLTFVNGFEPGQSVYQANAMLPRDGRVAITAQNRDARQSRIDITFDVGASGVPLGVLAWLLAGCVSAASGLALWARNRRPRP